MELLESVQILRSFWPDCPFPVGAGAERMRELQEQFEIEFSPDLQAYLAHAALPKEIELHNVGDSTCVLSSPTLGWEQLGYSVHGDSKERMQDWDPGWFLFATTGGDPVIVDLSSERASVQTAMHGCGEWDFDPIADSIGEYLLCASAMNHALRMLDSELVIIDDEHGYNLAKEPAEWLFPRMRKWSPLYWEDWCSVFDNAAET